ncbi:hypothetical protein P40081_15290 [Paenibacillus sp. FSL P4-0081]|uniref:hypothetical protein n=1 Tax=Paenibacillus sp. FSL P4-0081 TaxID=1536769 RepID=UPI0004F64BF7|nr:hypothetical protein [Paenibacillus sp. FSL P4-0081]AIQ29361.1 hypothetical protein P40081_15290 [Paenibacillus sp. FSL P4-0081]
MAKPTAEQLAKINQKALVSLTDEQVNVFQARIIGTKRIEKYMMKVTPNFLRKMADQVKEGVALLVDHPWQKWDALSFPYGRTFDSKIVEEGGELELYGDHYMAKGLEANGISTDQLAIGIDAGTIFDTSAGFVSTKHTCSICGGDYFRGSECSHMRGQEYEGKECLVLADDGYIMENSIVFDGGYEGAGITRGSLSTKPHAEADDQQQTEYEPLPLDAKSLNGDGRVFYFFSNKGGMNAFVSKQHQTLEQAKIQAEGDDTVTEEQKAALAAAQTQATALAAANGVLGQIRVALGVENDADIQAKLTALSAQAADGAAYKVKVTEQACGAGVRALGDAFNVEAMKTALSHLPVSEIEKINATYEAQAQAALGGGGRHTEGDNLDLPAGAANGTPPANAQANGAQKTPEQLREAAKAEARASLSKTGYGGIMKEAK